MADMWVSAFQVVAKSQWTPEFKQQIGEMVLKNLFEKWQDNSDVDPPEDTIKYMKSKNHKYLSTITVSTS